MTEIKALVHECCDTIKYHRVSPFVHFVVTFICCAYMCLLDHRLKKRVRKGKMGSW